MAWIPILPLLPVPDFVLPGLFLLFVMGLVPLVLIFGLLARWSGHYWAWTATLALGVVLLTWLTVQAVMIDFSAGIQYVMVVNGLPILGSALWPSVRKVFREENQ